MSAPPLLAQGLGKDPAAPEWPPLTGDEVARVLRRYGAERAQVRWRSPRPWSAAALVRCSLGTVFVKRHARAVRTPADLRTEHAFAAHLRAGGVPVPAVLATADGDTATTAGSWVYEAHAVADGADRYRDALSWTPYRTTGEAAAAGAQLARLHLAAASFDRPERPGPPLLCASAELLTAADPAAALDELLDRRPATAAYLDGRDGRSAVTALVSGFAAGADLAALPRSWAHNDWHGSNLFWTAGPRPGVAAVVDLGLANRTGPAFDLATALERSAISWLDLTDPAGARRPTVALEQARALLEGYRSVRPLTALERRALPRLLPVVHVELALSEVEYYLTVRPDPASVALAYDGYLLGHAEFFRGPAGRELLGNLADILGT